MYTRLIIAVLFVAAVAVNTATAQTTNSTTAPSNSTGGSSNGTTTAPSNSTGGSSNGTTTAPSNSTGGSGAVFPVAPLTTSISRAGCGSQQLCLSLPASCDPSTSGSCYFFSSQLLSGQTFQLGLSGGSSGYVAVALSTGTVGNGDTSFVCANNNNSVQFLTAQLNGNMLQRTSNTQVNVSSVKGSISGTTLQCLFNTTVPAGFTKSSNFIVQVGNGSYINNTLGNITRLIQQSVDLSNPSSSSNPSSNAIKFTQSLTQAVLIVAVALGLTM